MSVSIQLFEEFVASKSQISLPFKEKELRDDSPLAQIVAYLQHIAVKKRKLSPSKYYNTYLTENNWKKGYEIYLRDGHADYSGLYWSFISIYDPDDADIWFVDKLKTLDEDLDKNAIVDEFDSRELIEDFLTDRGKEEFEEAKEEHFKDAVQENGLFDALSDVDENGHISIYRSIVYHDDKGSYYEDAKQFEEVGIYWTFESNLAEPHSGYSSKASALEVIYHAKTNFASIDIPETLMVNAWTSKEEKEIRLNMGGLVEIHAIEMNGRVQQIKPIIVKA